MQARLLRRVGERGRGREANAFNIVFEGVGMVAGNGLQFMGGGLACRPVFLKACFKEFGDECKYALS